jgi:hypothetical protein
MGEAARGRVEVFHSPEQTVRAYERLWGEILGYDIRSQPGSC